MTEISVIIPTYGKPQFLEKAIKSVINQTYEDWELIIVDDNAPFTEERKATEQLVDDFLKTNSRIKYIKHKCNLNGAAARNTGLKFAMGNYIAFLDSDDQFIPTRLEKCLDKMQLVDGKIAGVYTGCEFRRKDKVVNSFTGVKTGNFIVETLACTFMFCTGSNIFMRKSIINDLKGFDESFLRHQDYEFLVRVFEKYDLIAIPEILVIKNDENFNLPNVKKIIEIKEKYRSKYQYILNQLNDKEVRYIYHSQFIQIAEAALKSGNKSLSKEYYQKACQYEKLTFKEVFRRIVFQVKLFSFLRVR